MTKYFLEIKNRIFLLITSYFTLILITYFYKETLLFLIVTPSFNTVLITKNNLPSFYFIFTNVTEIFVVYIKIILFISSQITFIFIAYHFFIFLSPAFFEIEYKASRLIIKTLTLTWIISIVLANYFIIPLTWNFFLSFQKLIDEQSFSIYFEAKLSEYSNFCISLYYLCNFYFQAFMLLILILNYINFDKNNIKKLRKLYYFFFVIFSTLISPPDIISQIVISFVLIMFYEILVFLFLLKNSLN
jgi:sec-independent protein translocase protein TatC